MSKLRMFPFFTVNTNYFQYTIDAEMKNRPIRLCPTHSDTVGGGVHFGLSANEANEEGEYTPCSRFVSFSSNVLSAKVDVSSIWSYR